MYWFVRGSTIVLRLRLDKHPLLASFLEPLNFDGEADTGIEPPAHAKAFGAGRGVSCVPKLVVVHRASTEMRRSQQEGTVTRRGGVCGSEWCGRRVEASGPALSGGIGALAPT